MLKTLIKKQLLELFQTYYINRKTGKARSAKGTVFFFGLMILLFVFLGCAFYAMASGLGGAILGHGFNWLYFALMGITAIALGVFGSVFNTYASLYMPKDNELMISLPIPAFRLLLARVAGVYVTSLMYSALIWIPAIIAFWMIETVTPGRVVFPILLTFIIALFVSVLSCILGWVVALIASKVKGKSFITVFLSLAVIALYYVVYFKAVDSLEEIVNYLGTISDKVKTWLHYSYLLGRAADGSLSCMILVTLITAALFLLIIFILSRTFTRLVRSGENAAKKIKKPANYSEMPVRNALLKREIKHFTSVSTWMLNGGFGLLLLPIGAVVLLIKSSTIRMVMEENLAMIPELKLIIPAAFAAAVCLILATGGLAPVAVSMEGKSLWIVQSLPIDTWEILRAKESMAVRFSVYPAIFLCLVGGTVLQMEVWEIIILCGAVWLFCWLMADFGLFLNLKKPNMSWTNPATLTKQSMPVVINMFGGWGFCIVLGAAGVYLSIKTQPAAALLLFAVIFFVLWQLLHRWLKKKGTEILRTLS